MASIVAKVEALTIKKGNSSSTDETTSRSATADLDVSARAQEHGWVKPMKYEYGVYTETDPDNLATALKNKANTEAEVQKELDRRAAKARADRGEAPEELFTADVPEWASNAKKYEWDDSFGEVGPAHEELEKQLFKDQYLQKMGKHAKIMDELSVMVESAGKVDPILRFEDAGLHPIMLANVKLCGYHSPTPVQAYCLPAIFLNRDIIAVAQTGSGKTAAFLIPTISKLMGKAKKLAAPRPKVTAQFDFINDGVRAEPLILVVAPTRELAVQIFDEARRLCYRSMLRPCVAYGGGPSREQADELRKGCDILIATPGRLIDFMNRPSLLSLSRVRYTVIDEADELVGPDWIEDMKQILSGGDNNEDADHRYMLFSATFPKNARQLAKEHMDEDHIRIRVGRAGSTHQTIDQNIIFVEEEKKRECLYDLLLVSPPARTIIFVNSKRSADFLDDYLYNKGLPSTSIHSDRTQREREDALRAFRSGKTPILVATGVSARGLDILHVMHIINYDLPSAEHGGIQEYVHRIGRTARIGNDGVASSFYNDRNEDIAAALVNVLIESKQKVPDFLEQFKPDDGEEPDFDDDSEEGEGEGVAGKDGGDGWDDDDAQVVPKAKAEEPEAFSDDW